METEKKTLLINSFIFYSLIKRDSISVTDIMKKVKDLQQDTKFEKHLVSFNRKDLMFVALSWPFRLKVEFENKDWVLHKIPGRALGLPMGENFFSDEHLDRVYGTQYFEDPELLKSFKEIIV